MPAPVAPPVPPPPVPAPPVPPVPEPPVPEPPVPPVPAPPVPEPPVPPVLDPPVPPVLVPPAPLLPAAPPVPAAPPELLPPLAPGFWQDWVAESQTYPSAHGHSFPVRSTSSTVQAPAHAASPRATASDRRAGSGRGDNSAPAYRKLRQRARRVRDQPGRATTSTLPSGSAKYAAWSPQGRSDSGESSRAPAATSRAIAAGTSSA